MKKYIAIILISGLAIMSCSTPKALEYKTYHNFSINKLGFDNSTISMDLEYYNPNNFGMQLKRTDLDIFINGNMLGHSSTDSTLKIPRNSSFLIPIKFNVDMQNIFKNAYNALTGKEVLVKLTGKIKIGKGNVFMSLPVDYESKQTFSFF
ncbi:MAG: LEA type 2 family protein [Ginsengibacter sp.]|jgi:LEA14-like dessication related protein